MVDLIWEVCPIVPLWGGAIAVLQLYREKLALGAHALAWEIPLPSNVRISWISGTRVNVTQNGVIHTQRRVLVTLDRNECPRRYS
jgi:hypothetical protein